MKTYFNTYEHKTHYDIYKRIQLYNKKDIHEKVGLILKMHA